MQIARRGRSSGCNVGVLKDPSSLTDLVFQVNLRIKLVRTRVNGGGPMARNHGIAARA